MKKLLTYISLPILITVMILCEKLYMKHIAALKIPCIFHLLTGFWCPGCGITRSINALFNGHILTSLRYNPAPVMIIIFILLFYIQKILQINGIKKRILPADENYVLIICFVMIFYYLIRNFIPLLIP